MHIANHKNLFVQKNKHVLLGLVIVIAAFLFDIFSKYYIENIVKDRILIKGLLQIKVSKNTGMAFSILNQFPIIVTAIGIIAIIFLIYLWKKHGMFFLSITIGGALGNIIDRILFGSVTDFISILKFPIFNFGDVLIFVGIALTLIHETRKNKMPENIQLNNNQIRNLKNIKRH